MKKSILIGLGVLAIIIILIVGLFISFTVKNAPRNSYLSQMQNSLKETKGILDEYSLTSKKLSNHTITSSQALESFNAQKSQLENIRNKSISVTPPEDFQEAHQHYLIALDLLIESYNLTISGIENTDMGNLYLTINKLNQAKTEIETFTDLVKKNS